MGSSRVIDTSVAIQEGRNLHGDKYDYTLLEYVNYQTPLKILCPEHGLFEQKYQKHCKLGRGCWECGKKSCVEKRNKYTQESVIELANKVHNNFYSYSNAIYTSYISEMSVSCPIHGDFEQVVSTHLMGSGCSKCGIIKAGKSRTRDKEKILNRFKEVHGEFYTYNLPDNVKGEDIIKIFCPLHGDFSQTVNLHYKCGCKKCGDIRTSEALRKIPIELKRVVKNIKRRVKGFIKNEGYRKTSSTSQIIGIDWLSLKEYLEDNPYNFKVDCEDLDIDHILPLCSVREESDIYKLNHYTNLQLLPRIYNQFVKKEKPFDRLDFENWLIETSYNKC